MIRIRVSWMFVMKAKNEEQIVLCGKLMTPVNFLCPGESTLDEGKSHLSHNKYNK